MSKLTYKNAGVDYDSLDRFKRQCQQQAATTTHALAAHGFKEPAGIRGESAYLIESQGGYLAHVEEALGTKVCVADEVYAQTGRSFYRAIGIDTVATIVNDLCSAGALPVTVAMYLATGSAAYLQDEQRAGDLARGFAEGCRRAGAVWGGGETQMLQGVVNENTVVLGGSSTGHIASKTFRVQGDVEAGDQIILLASSGVQTNGITLCRHLVDRLPDGYQTQLSDGRTYGEALLDPSHIYVSFVAACQQQGVRLRYLVHMTGHGWRKLMRLEAPLSYEIHDVGRPQPVFKTIVDAANLDPAEAYGTFNMGVGFAAVVRPDDAEACLKCARDAGYTVWSGGVVKPGPRRVVLSPLDVIYTEDQLRIR